MIFSKYWGFQNFAVFRAKNYSNHSVSILQSIFLEFKALSLCIWNGKGILRKSEDNVGNIFALNWNGSAQLRINLGEGCYRKSSIILIIPQNGKFELFGILQNLLFHCIFLLPMYKNFKINSLVNTVHLKISVFSAPKNIFYNHLMSDNRSFGWLGPLSYENESCQCIMG